MTVSSVLHPNCPLRPDRIALSSLPAQQIPGGKNKVHLKRLLWEKRERKETLFLSMVQMRLSS